MTERTRITRRPETRELIVERLLPVLCERVWLGWTRPEQLARWWGPRAWAATIHEMDVRPGGVWRYTLAPKDGAGELVRCKATYREVEEPARLAYVDTFADELWQSVAGSEMDTLVTFEPVQRQTLITITTRFASAADLDSAEAMGMIEGFAAALDRLDTWCRGL
ncbi:MAG TPA: SRPBCC domain-containing protein [Propionibacteriaceae bacterium]|jgi:uncharacterized protein YndB with AHSA1/START domain|nr:SRPBCC domain-containing protein [Propionibacteriaceae bacterium]